MYTDSWLLNHYSRLLKPFNLSDKQYFVLKILNENYPNAVSVNFILERMLDKMSNVSRLVDKLVDKQLVIKVQSTNDKRAKDIIISPKGKELLILISKKMNLWESSSTKLTREEIKMLNFLLDKMRS